MILPRREDALHKAMMYRLLIGLLDNSKTSKSLYFKGGTCASMLGFLDRFSIDLDFDLKKGAEKRKLGKELKDLINQLDFQIKEESASELFFILKYDSKGAARNTLKLSIIDFVVKANIYKPQYLKEIDRFAVCQTIETMFANKLIAVIDRYEKFKTIAGRDIYDIHHFFSRGYDYSKAVIEERRKVSADKYLRELIDFITKQATEKIISQDLNYLLPVEKFKAIRKTLKSEVLVYLRDEVKKNDLGIYNIRPNSFSHNSNFFLQLI